MKMHELVSWFQMEYPKLVKDMKDNCHHFYEEVPFGVASNTGHKVSKLEGGLNFIEYDGLPPEPMFFVPYEKLVNTNPYHIEGDVWTHTMMVCKQAEKENELVQIGALLHDIGKPSCRKVNIEKRKVSFYNHESVSAFMALEVMQKLELNSGQKRMIFQMIALHTEPFKQTPELMQKTLIDNYELANNLYTLNRCDHQGRFHSDDPEQKLCLPIVGTFREKKAKEVIMLCGLPCSGKSTYIENELPDHFVVSRDDIIHGMFPDLSYNEAFKAANSNTVNKKLQERLTQSLDYDKVVIDMTNLTKKGRRKRLSRFGEDYLKECVVFVPTLKEIKERNEARTGKVIDERVFDRMIKTFYPPMYDVFDVINYKF